MYDLSQVFTISLWISSPLIKALFKSVTKLFSFHSQNHVDGILPDVFMFPFELVRESAWSLDR